MKTFAKVIAWIAAIIIAIVVIAAIIFKHTVDPNDYKKQITQAVQHHTGHPLTIKGKIELSLFPWLGVDIHNVSFGNPKGFSGKQLAAIGEAQVRVKLLPMLIGKFEVGHIVLKNADINLVTLASGKSNWHDLVKQGPTSAKTNTHKHHAQNKPLAHKQVTATTDSISVANINIDNANVNITNAVTKKDYHLTHFTLNANTVNLQGNEFTVNSSFNVAQSQPLLALSADIQGTFSIDSKKLSANNFNLSGKISALHTQLAKSVPYAIEFRKFSAQDEQHFQLQDLNIELANLKLDASIIANNEAYNGNIALQSFDPSQLLSALALDHNNKNLQHFNQLSFDSKISTDGHIIKVTPLVLSLNNNKVHAQATYNSKTAYTQFNITADKLDLDTLEPSAGNSRKAHQKSTNASSTTSSSATKASAQLPLAMLRHYGWQGTVAIKTLMVHGLTLHQLRAKTENHAGNVILGPIAANMYQGKFISRTQFDASSNTAHMSSTTKVSNVQLAPISAALAGKQVISGDAGMSLALTSSGNTPQQIIGNLAGEGNVHVGKGQLNGFDLDHLVAQAKSLLGTKTKTADKVNNGNDTQFSSIKASYKIKHGIISNNDLLLTTPYAQANGQGRISLTDSWIDYRLSAGPLAVHGKQPWNFPVIIKGALTKPSIRPDIDSLLRQLLKNKIGNAISKALGDGSDNKGSDHGDKLNSLIKGIFH